MSIDTKLERLFLMALLLAIAPGVLFGQAGSAGTIVGTVTDATGAVVPNATITARHLETNFTQTQASGAAGGYTFPYIPAGNYEIRATIEGFRASVSPDVKLDVGSTFRVDFVLELGQVTETVEVTAAAPTIQTDEASVGHLIEEKRIVELPLNGRKFEQLQILSPGSVNAFNHQTSSGLAGGASALQSTSQPTAIATSGSRPNQMLILVDGGSVTNNYGRTATVSPNPDEVAEFKISSSNFSAEYGYGSNVINVSTKSGTNSFRATLWEFFRNKKLSSTNFFANEPEPLKRNQFGAAAGGPVVRNKSFWYANFEVQRERRGFTRISSVPTAAMRSGDLSGLPNQIFDPMTTRADASSPSGSIRNRFLDDRIPAARLDQNVAQRFLEWIPLPNGDGFANNYDFTTSQINDYEHFSGRFDHRVTDNDLLMFRASYQPSDFPYATGPYGPDVKPPYEVGTWPKTGIGSSAVLGWTKTFNPTTLMDARISFARVWLEIGNLGVVEGGTDWTTEAGIQGFGPGVSDVYPSVPGLNIAGFTGIGGFGGFGLTDTGNNWEYTTNFTLIRGDHTIKLGYAHRRWQQNLTTWGTGSGVFTYNGEYSANPASRGGTGSGLADYLLSVPFSAYRYIPLGWFYEQMRNHWFYIQDDWKISPNLTLNIGLRYELNFPTEEKYQSLASFEPSGRGGKGAIVVCCEEALTNGIALHTATRLSLETYRPLIRTAEELNIRPQSMRPLFKKSFAPRFGFAYRATPKTVVRGGYGLFYIQLDGNRESEFISPPFIVRESNLLNKTNKVGMPLRNTQNLLAGAQFSPEPNLFAHSPNDGLFGYTQQWNLFVQRELGWKFVMDLGYVGNRGNALQQTRSINIPRPGPGPVQPRRPFPEFNTISYSEQSGYSIYHGFQAKLERRFTAGVSLGMAYTRSKLIDLNSANTSVGFDPYDLRHDRGLGDFDSPNVFSMSFVYEIPFMRSARGAPKAILGGWSVTSIITASDGYPFTSTWAGDTGNRGAGSRPDRLCNGTLGNPTHERWFDVDCFGAPAGAFAIGNSGRNILRGPQIFNWDFGLHKEFSFTETRRLQFRAEFFNFTNTTNFAHPAATINSGAPGVITSAAPPRIIQLGLKLYL